MVARFFIVMAFGIYFTVPAMAESNPPPIQTAALHHYDLSFQGSDSVEPFTLSPEKEKEGKAPPLLYGHKNAISKPHFAGDDISMEDKLIAKVPQGKNLKKLWHVVDGDVDLHFEGLRADRGNKGVKYTTKTLPLIGTMESTEFKFEAGEDTEFSFESNALPFGREIDGFQLKGSVGENSKISARYIIAFDEVF